MVKSSISFEILASAQNNLSDFSINLFTQTIHFVSHGAESLNSAMYISYNLKLSAQYSSTISSGLITFHKDLLIFQIFFVNSSFVSLWKYFQFFSSTESI